MDVDSRRQVARLVLDALDDEGLVIRAMVERRGEVVAVVVENDAVRRTVIVEWRNGAWEVPQVIGGSPPDVSGRRPRTTTGMRPFFDHHVKQSGWATSDGGRPSVVWQAVTGFAAEDAEAVIVTTDCDEYEAEVAADGFFVTLARAPWRTEPGVSVRKRSGELVNVQL